jgi:hypothetical protein
MEESDLRKYLKAIEGYFNNPEGDPEKWLNGVNAIHNLVEWAGKAAYYLEEVRLDVRSGHWYHIDVIVDEEGYRSLI